MDKESKLLIGAEMHEAVEKAMDFAEAEREGRIKSVEIHYGSMTATEIMERKRQAEKQIRIASACGMGAKALCEAYVRDLVEAAALESVQQEWMWPLGASIMGNPHAHSISTSIPDWFGAGVVEEAVDDDEPFDEIDAPPEMVDVHYVLCKKCGASALKESFYFNGARINDCKCKPGREEWINKTIKQEVGDRPKDVIPPAKR